MSTDDRIRWDQQHLKSLGTEPPSAFIREILESNAWPALCGSAMDIACGKGRNAIYLAQRGFAVTALDISAVALEEGRRRAQQQDLKIDWHLCDLEARKTGGSGLAARRSDRSRKRIRTRKLGRADEPRACAGASQ